MAKRVQLIRHSTGAADNFTGKSGEITVDLTKKELRVHDNLTAGGIAVARADLVNVNLATTASDGKMAAADKVELTAATANIAQEITDRVADVDAEEARALTAEGVLQDNIDTEAVTRGAADTVLQDNINALANMFFPVGAVVVNTNNVNPATYIGIGTWAKTARGRALVGEGTSDQAFTAGSTGGASNTGTHTHGATGLTSSIVDGTYGTGLAGVASGAGKLIFDALGSNNHSHTGTVGGATAADGAHSNLQPYEVFYVWKRIS